MIKRIIPYMNVNEETSALLLAMAEEYENNGADELCICDYRPIEAMQEEFLLTAKTVIKTIDIPVTVGVHVKRFEDVKKAFYTGAKAVVLRFEELANSEVIKEAVQRFGKDQILVELQTTVSKEQLQKLAEYGVSNIVCSKTVMDVLTEEEWKDFDVLVTVEETSIPSYCDCLNAPMVTGIVTMSLPAYSVMSYKMELKQKGYEVNTFDSKIDFSEFKLDSNGLIPAIVQDYKTNEVLMLGYMNKESFEKTIKTGCMTYYSRSRQELWVKGETSGHYQYVRELKLDCDKDTILAKVKQIGAACHTGNQSCFFNDLMTKEYDSTNPFTVFEDVYGVIMDRKEHPKEGSYTNYLFDKGIDKILKKCGEEATEIVIAAKNPEVEELKYEISDFLYHCMVLMAERGVDWKDITKELAHRR